MSFLSNKATPFRRAPMHEQPHLPSPPETNTDFFQPHELMPEPEALPHARRTSTLSYRSTPLREPTRERAPANPSRWLVVVVPPEALTPHLGGPAARASQGTLMPLLPTLYAQLTAIAREFSFPSAVGLCLYLHINEHGLVLTPRVSDDTWQILWGHLFDARSPTAPTLGQIPVAGRVELDIDPAKARWFGAWIAARQRAEMSLSAAPSVAPSHHWRGESKTTILGEFNDRGDDQSDVLQPAPAPRPRQVPRQLSLLDRFDTASVASSSGLRDRERDRGHAHDEHALPTIHSAALSPTRAHSPSPKRSPPLQPPQEEESPARPKPPRDLSIRVKSWRASASIAPSPLAATGQISLDAAHMPNHLPLPSPTAAPVDEDVMRLEDFQWDASSAGPGTDCDPLYTPAAWVHAPSVDLAGRAAGSVLMSPSSAATSWGPPSDGGFSWAQLDASPRAPSVDLGARLESSAPPSPASVATSWGPVHDDDYVHEVASVGVHTPDAGHRGFEDAPLTPTTATSWGPQSWPASPAPAQYAHYTRAHQDAHTPDAGHRGFENAPLTATTATSWGPGSYPASPAQYAHVRAHTPDAGHRGAEHAPLTASTATSWGPGSYPASPLHAQYAHRRAHTPDVALRAMHSAHPTPLRASYVPRDVAAPVRDAVAMLAFPHFRPREEASRGVWPFHVARPEAVEVVLRAAYPALDVYPAAYPHMEIYPGNLHKFEPEVKLSTRLAPAYPHMGIYEAVYPHFEIYPGNVVAFEPFTQLGTKLAPTYPHMAIYEAVYPHFEIYPGNLLAYEPYAPLTAKLGPSYPHMAIYEVVYPHFEIYPGNVVAYEPFTQLSVKLAPAYPHMAIYEAVYPHFEIYPGNVLAFAPFRSLSTALAPAYPHLSVYAAVYPHFEIYPGHAVSPRAPARKRTSFSPAASAAAMAAAFAFARAAPAPAASAVRKRPVSAARSAAAMDAAFAKAAAKFVRPQMRVAPAASKTVWPFFEPSVSRTVWPFFAPVEPLRPVDVALHKAYPALDIYPAAYPHMEIYPGNVHAFEPEVKLSVKLAPEYPHMAIYEAVYPHFEIYPGNVVAFEPFTQLSVKLAPSYPHMAIYEAVYPHFEIYPGNLLAYEPYAPLTAKLGPSYPHMAIYEVVYPHFEIYPGNVVAFEPFSPLSVKLAPTYPHMAIYEAVYPNFEIYPGNAVPAISAAETARQTATNLAAYPHFEIYVGHVHAHYAPARNLAAYPWFEIYAGNVVLPAAERVANMVWPLFLLDRAACHYVWPLYTAPTPPKKHARTHSAAASAAAMAGAFAVAAEKAAAPKRRSGSAAASAAAMANAFAAAAHKTAAPVRRSRSAAASAAAMSAAFEAAAAKSLLSPVKVVLSSEYPALNIYPAAYPHFEIYPGHLHRFEAPLDKLLVRLEPKYPVMDIYPATYPHFEIYPGNVVAFQPLPSLSVKLAPVYPFMRIYETVYPSFEIYPGNLVKYRRSKTGHRSHPSESCGVYRPRHTHAQLHAQVFPRKQGAVTGWASYTRPRRTHAQLHAEVFALMQLAVPTPPAADEHPPVPWQPISGPGEDADADLKAAAKRQNRNSLGLRSSAPSPVNTVAHKLSPVVRPPPTPVTTAFVQHRRTESSESTSSIDSATGLSRRRDPPPNAMRAPTLRRRSVAQQEAPPPVPPVPVIEEPAPPPAPVRRLPEVVSKNGLPTNPAGLRRSVSSSSAAIPPLQRQYGMPLSPVPERPMTALHRSTSLAHSRRPSAESVAPLAPGNAPSPLSGRIARRPAGARDSFVLERARLFDNDATSPDEPTRITMRHLAEFPAPPMPPVPQLPPTSPNAQRPVSRLDRSKYPFA